MVYGAPEITRPQTTRNNAAARVQTVVTSDAMFQDHNNSNNDTNRHDNVYGAVITGMPLREFTRFLR